MRLELTRPIGPAVFGTASSSSRIRSQSGGADSNRLLGVHIPALCRLSYAPETRSRRDSTRPARQGRRRRSRRAERGRASGQSSTRNLPIDSRARWPLRYSSNCCAPGNQQWHGERMTLPPGSRVISCEHAIRAPATTGARVSCDIHASIGCQRAGAGAPKRRSPHPAACAQVGRSFIPVGSWTSDLTVPSQSLPPALCCPADTTNPDLRYAPRLPASDGIGIPMSCAPTLGSGTRRLLQPRFGPLAR